MLMEYSLRGRDSLRASWALTAEARASARQTTAPARTVLALFPCLQRLRACGPTAFISSFPERQPKIAAELQVPQAGQDITCTYCCESSRQLPMNMRVAAREQSFTYDLGRMRARRRAASIAHHSQRRWRNP